MNLLSSITGTMLLLSTAHAQTLHGEALIFGPDGNGGATHVARVKVEEWPKLQ